MPITPILVGSERIRRRSTMAASLRKGRRIEHAGGALGASVAGVGAGSGEGNGVERLQRDGGFGDERAEFPVAGMKAERDGGSVGSAQAAVGAEDEDFRARASFCGSQPMPAFWLRPKRLPEGAVSSISGVMGSRPRGPGAWVATSSSLRVVVSRTEVREMVGMGFSCQGQL